MPSHGSLTKAGKVRKHTLEMQKAGAMPKAKPKKNLAPRIRNRKEYIRYLSKKIKPLVLALADKYHVSPSEELGYLIKNVNVLIEEANLKDHPQKIKQALILLRDEREFR